MSHQNVYFYFFNLPHVLDYCLITKYIHIYPESMEEVNFCTLCKLLYLYVCLSVVCLNLFFPFHLSLLTFSLLFLHLTLSIFLCH